MPVSRDFRGRRKREAEPDRLPPGQYVTDDFPVLSAGPTPHTPLEQWSFSVVDGEETRSWTCSGDSARQVRHPASPSSRRSSVDLFLSFR